MANTDLKRRIEEKRLKDEQLRRNLVQSMREGAVIRGGLTDEQANALREKMKETGVPPRGEGGGPLR